MTLRLRREALAELAAADLAGVNGAAAGVPRTLAIAECLSIDPTCIKTR